MTTSDNAGSDLVTKVSTMPNVPEDILRQGGIQVIRPEDMSKHIKKAIYKKLEAKFALYNGSDYVILSYDRQIDPQIIDLIGSHTLGNINKAQSLGEVEQLQSGMRSELKTLQSGSYVWLDNPERFEVEENKVSRDLETDIMRMDYILYSPILKELGNKYGFPAVSRRVLNQVNPDLDGFKLTMLYTIATNNS